MKQEITLKLELYITKVCNKYVLTKKTEDRSNVSRTYHERNFIYKCVLFKHTNSVETLLPIPRSASYPQKSMRFFPPFIPMDIDTDCSVQNTEDLTIFDDLVPEPPLRQSGGGMLANDLLNLPIPLGNNTQVNKPLYSSQASTSTYCAPDFLIIKKPIHYQEPYALEFKKDDGITNAWFSPDHVEPLTFLHVS